MSWPKSDKAPALDVVTRCRTRQALARGPAPPVAAPASASLLPVSQSRDDRPEEVVMVRGGPDKSS